MRFRDLTRLYKGEISPRTDHVFKAVSSAIHAPVLSAITFILLNLRAKDPVGMIVSDAIALLTATVLPVLMVRHSSVKYGNTDGDVVQREDRARPLMGGCFAICRAQSCCSWCTRRASPQQ